MERADALNDRNFQFALRIIRLCQKLRTTPEGQVLFRQLLRAGTGIASNYRASRRSRSGLEFASRLATVEEEADESLLWLDLIWESGILRDPDVQILRTEAAELRAIYAKSRRTVKENLKRHAARSG